MERLRKGLLRSLWFVLLLNLVVAPACTQPNNNNNNNNNNQTGECTTDQNCWDLRCPNKAEYKACMKKRLAPKSEISGEQLPPEFVVCQEDKKCKDLPATELGGGQVDVLFPDNISKQTRDSVKALILYIFPSKDLNGKEVTCQRVKDAIAKAPESLMTDDWGRYHPPRDYDSPTTVPIQRPGDSLPLLFSGLHPTVPVGKHVVVVLGFCDTGGLLPSASTKPKWIACKEDAAFVAGEKSNKVNINFPISNADSCF